MWCGQDGHRAVECRKRTQEQTKPFAQSFKPQTLTRTCMWCAKNGHTAAECYTRIKQQQPSNSFKAGVMNTPPMPQIPGPSQGPNAYVPPQRPPPIVCYKCGQAGHTQKFCRAQMPVQYGPRQQAPPSRFPAPQPALNGQGGGQFRPRPLQYFQPNAGPNPQ